VATGRAVTTSRSRGRTFATSSTTAVSTVELARPTTRIATPSRATTAVGCPLLTTTERRESATARTALGDGSHARANIQLTWHSDSCAVSLVRRWRSQLALFPDPLLLTWVSALIDAAVDWLTGAGQKSFINRKNNEMHIDERTDRAQNRPSITPYAAHKRLPVVSTVMTCLTPGGSMKRSPLATAALCRLDVCKGVINALINCTRTRRHAHAPSQSSIPVGFQQWSFKSNGVVARCWCSLVQDSKRATEA
jgi:hypothetical protein